MPLPQNISPFNSELMDTLVKAKEVDWIPNADDPKRSFIKILYTGSETGSWVVLTAMAQGLRRASAQASERLAYFHSVGEIAGAHRDVLNAGDYVYEANGMVHGATTALEDTEYLFICNGPVLFFNEDATPPI